MANDEDYRKNQADCQERWSAKNPDYWKKYRDKNPEYTQRNREKQRQRDRSKSGSKANTSIFRNLAKMDASKAQKSIISGMYELIPVKRQNLAKMDALIVEINEITEGYS